MDSIAPVGERNRCMLRPCKTRNSLELHNQLQNLSRNLNVRKSRTMLHLVILSRTMLHLVILSGNNDGKDYEDGGDNNDDQEVHNCDNDNREDDDHEDHYDNGDDDDDNDNTYDG